MFLNFDDAKQALEIAGTLSRVLNDPQGAGARIAEAAQMLDKVVKAEAELRAATKVWEAERRAAAEELMSLKVAIGREEKARAIELGTREQQLDAREEAAAAIEKSHAKRADELARRDAELAAAQEAHEQRAASVRAALG